MKTISSLLLIILLVSGCAGSSTQVVTDDTRPTLAFKGAPRYSTLYIDGLRIGNTNDYNGKPDVLMVESGTHYVVIESRDGSKIYSKEIFVGSGLKIIHLK